MTEDFPRTLAHELFHCVQYATLSSDQMATLGSGADWWIEGSAEAYAVSAIADGRGTADWGAEFNEKVSARTPLYEMSCDAVILFYWLIQSRDVGGVLPFLAGVSGERCVAGQRAAIRDALTDGQWRHFAEAYSDDAILHPHRQALWLQGRFPVEYLHVEATGSQRITFEPFAVISGRADYACVR